MEAPKRKITAKVNADAGTAPSPVPTRPPSQASNVLLDLSTSSSPSSPSPSIRPKAKLTPSTSLKVGPTKSPSSTLTNGRKTPVSNVGSRSRPASVIGPPPSATRRPMAPVSQPVSPMLPPTRPQARTTAGRATSPVLRPVRRVKSPDARSDRRLMSPSFPDRADLSPSPTLTRRVASPIAPAGRRLGSPIRAPPLTIPKRGVSPTRSRGGPSSHRRVASASSALSTSSVGPTKPPPVKPRLPQSLSAITLDRPAPFSAIPKSPPKSADPVLSPPLPPLPVPEPEPEPDTHEDYDSTSDLSNSSVPPSPAPTLPPVLLSAQNAIHVATSSAPVTPTHIQTPVSDVPPIRPRTASITLGPNTPPTSTIQPQSNATTSLAPGIRIKAKITPPVPEPDDSASELSMSDSSVPPSPAPILPPVLLSAHSAPVTPAHIQTPVSDVPPGRPRTASVTLGPHTPPTSTIQPQSQVNATTSLGPGIRIKAKITPTTSTSTKPPFSFPPPPLDSGSVSGGSTITGITPSASTITTTTKQATPSMINGASSIRVSAHSRILSPPPSTDRRIPFLGLNLSGMTFPGSSAALQSPPASTISSSMSSASASSRRSLSFVFGGMMDGARTPTTDLSLGRRMSGGGLGSGGGGREFGGGGGGLGIGGGEDEERERDDSGIDMFEADDGDLREEARSNRKIADLEISNKSLLAINATLESTKARQAKEIRDLRRKLRESRLVLPHHTFVALEKSDPLAPESGSVEDEEDSDENEGDVTQTQADETFARVKLLLDGLIGDAKAALETGPTRISDKAGIGGPSIRVLNVHDVEDDYATGRSEAETDDADDADDVGESEDEIESIDGVSPLSETPPVPISTGGAFSGLRSSLGRWM